MIRPPVLGPVARRCRNQTQQGPDDRETRSRQNPQVFDWRHTVYRHPRFTGRQVFLSTNLLRAERQNGKKGGYCRREGLWPQGATVRTERRCLFRVEILASEPRPPVVGHLQVAFTRVRWVQQVLGRSDTTASGWVGNSCCLLSKPVGLDIGKTDAGKTPGRSSRRNPLRSLRGCCAALGLPGGSYADPWEKHPRRVG